nr:BrnT family toxin [uncultured Rhodopila sp.]
MTYIVIPEAGRDFEWDQRKSDRNVLEREIPFDPAILLFKRPSLERRDLRRDYGEPRVLAIGHVGGVILHCIYLDRGPVRRIISLRRANGRESDAYRAAFQN